MHARIQWFVIDHKPHRCDQAQVCVGSIAAISRAREKDKSSPGVRGFNELLKKSNQFDFIKPTRA
jgi:hypothetical protein